MFDEKINTIKKLGELECTIYEFSTAIFLRENTLEKDFQIEKFSGLIDSKISKNDILVRKNTLIEKYEKIVLDFLEMIESLYAHILEKIQNAETNQNVVYIKKATFEHLLELKNKAETPEDKEKLIKSAKKINISLENLEKKIYIAEERIKQYDEIIRICEQEFKECEHTRNVEINKFLIEKEISNDTIDKILNELEEKVLITNVTIANYINSFNSKIDVLQNEILE